MNFATIILQLILFIYFISVVIKYWNKKDIPQHIFKTTIFVLLIELASSIIIDILDILR